MVISVNPYRQLDIFGNDYVQKYVGKASFQVRRFTMHAS